MKEFFLSPFGFVLSLFVKSIIISACMCGGMDMLQIVKEKKFSNFRGIFGFFLIILGIKIFLTLLQSQFCTKY